MMKTGVTFLWMMLVAACATSPDRFYALSPRPDAPAQRAVAPDVELALTVALPPLVDRPQFVVETNGGVHIQEHERWAAPLADQVQSVLGQDLERRRSDVFVTARSAGANAVHIDIDVISLTARLGSAVNLNVRWRVRAAGSGTQAIYGREAFTCQAAQGYNGVADAASECLGQLADRLVAALPGH